jgi:small subunit ribosomal protein S2
LEKFIGGIKLMNNLPKILITTDAIKEKNAILEAQCINKNIKFRKITIISLANVNASPDLIDYLIPCNTNSSKAQ